MNDKVSHRAQQASSPLFFTSSLLSYIPTQEVSEILDRTSAVRSDHIKYAGSLLSEAPIGQQALYLLYIIPQRVITGVQF